jgi:hypothetical protein
MPGEGKRGASQGRWAAGQKSGVRPMPPEQLANWQGQSKPIIVDLDTEEPGASERYSYVCASSPTGTVFVQRILN